MFVVAGGVYTQHRRAELKTQLFLDTWSVCGMLLQADKDYLHFRVKASRVLLSASVLEP